MARANTSERQALWQPGGAEEDSHFCEDERHLHLAYDKEEVLSRLLVVDMSLVFAQCGFSVPVSMVCHSCLSCSM